MSECPCTLSNHNQVVRHHAKSCVGIWAVGTYGDEVLRRLEWIIDDGTLRDARGSVAFRSCGAFAGQGVV
jgi:hypothetical protein